MKMKPSIRKVQGNPNRLNKDCVIRVKNTPPKPAPPKKKQMEKQEQHQLIHHNNCARSDLLTIDNSSSKVTSFQEVLRR